MFLTKPGTYLSVLDLSSNFKLKVEDLTYLKELCEIGKLKSVIDKCYPMEQIVKAHKYVDGGHKKRERSYYCIINITYRTKSKLN